MMLQVLLAVTLVCVWTSGMTHLHATALHFYRKACRNAKLPRQICHDTLFLASNLAGLL